MGRTTVYNNITSEESLSRILPENKSLMKDFLDYMKSIISRYEADENAVVVIDDKVYEKMHINRLKKIISENS